MATARAARRLGVDTVVGFTGSKIWKTALEFVPRLAFDPPAAAFDAPFSSGG